MPHAEHLFTGAVVSQDEFGVPSPGTCGPGTPCKQWFIRITNEATLLAAAGDRPQVFFSGCLHGDERIGPTSVTCTEGLLAQRDRLRGTG